MDIQFIDITSYRGISSNAEHYYAKIGDPEYVQENAVTSLSCDLKDGVCFINKQDLKYYPTQYEAEKMWLKDNNGIDNQFFQREKSRMIDDMCKEGTIRFPSIISIIKEARKKFPDSILCFSMQGSRKEFVKYMQKLYDKDRKSLDEIFDIIGL